MILQKFTGLIEMESCNGICDKFSYWIQQPFGRKVCIKQLRKIKKASK
jgi:hypothetical protein